MMPIPHSRPMISRQDKLAVSAVLAGGQISMGPVVADFEKAFVEKFSLRGCAGVSSGSAALRLALLGLGVRPGDEVIIPSFVCTAILNAVRQVGAREVVADVDERGHLSASDARKRLTAKTRAVIVAHMFGYTADLAGIIKLGVPVIEDCAQAVGALYNGRPVGSWGTAGIFSFYATKMMTTAEGGMVASRDRRVMERVRDLLSYDHKADYKVRYNDKMTDIQAALGLSQLKRLDWFIARRRQIARAYDQVLGVEQSAEPVFYRYVIRVRQPEKIIFAAKARGIHCERPLFRPLHRYLGLKGYPASEQLFREGVSIPIYPSLSVQEKVRVCSFLGLIIDKRLS